MIINIIESVLFLLLLRQFNVGQQFTTAEQTDTVTDLLNLVQMMGREQHRQPLFMTQLMNQVHKLTDTGRVYS